MKPLIPPMAAGLALLVAGCNVVTDPSPAPMRARVENRTTIQALHEAPSLVKLHPNLTKGSIAVKVNGKSVGVLGRGEDMDLAPYLRPGANVVALAWTKPVSGAGRIEVASRNSTLRHYIRFTLPTVRGQKAGVHQLNVEIPSNVSTGSR